MCFGKSGGCRQWCPLERYRPTSPRLQLHRGGGGGFFEPDGDVFFGFDFGFHGFAEETLEAGIVAGVGEGLEDAEGGDLEMDDAEGGAGEEEIGVIVLFRPRGSEGGTGGIRRRRGFARREEAGGLGFLSAELIEVGFEMGGQHFGLGVGGQFAEAIDEGADGGVMLGEEGGKQLGGRGGRHGSKISGKVAERS